MNVPNLVQASWRRSTLEFRTHDGARAFVWATWVIMFVAALAFVRRYGSSLPRHDEFNHMVLLLTGEQELSLSTLWQQHNEYRWPLPKLLLLLLLKLADADFRAGMFACAIALGGLSSALILAAGRLRGRTSVADAFFPIVLLHWGHYENLLMGTQVCYTLPLCFACIILLIIAANQQGLTPRSAAVAGVCLLGLPLCGGSGVLLTPALAIWLGGAGVFGWLAPGPHRRIIGLVSLACASGALLLVVLYFVGFQRPAHHPPSPSLSASIRHSLKCLAMGLGPGVEASWPYSAAAVAALLLAGTGLLLARGLGVPRERRRAAGLLLLMCATGCVVLAVGWTRAGLGPQQAFASRYCVLSIPILCTIFLSAILYSHRKLGKSLQISLFLLSCLMLPLNTRNGKTWGEYIGGFMRRFERDLRRGVPAPELARRHGRFIYVAGQEPFLSRTFLELSRARVGKFRFLQPGSSSREVAIPVVPGEDRSGLRRGTPGCTLFLIASRPMVGVTAAAERSPRRRLAHPTSPSVGGDRP
jgi:hypothetical protein